MSWSISHRIQPRLVFPYLLLCASLGGAPGVPDPCTPPANMSAWWPAENSGSDVVGSNPLTPQNGAGYGAGFVGQAFALDGVDDYLSAPDAPALRSVNFTVEGWFNFASTSGIRMLFAKSVGSGSGE